MQFRRLALAASSILFAAGLGFAAGPGVAGSAPAAKKLVVAVSVLPQAYFVERVGGDRVRAFALVGPGQSPHSYEPSPRQMAELGQASLWLTVGIEFEHGLEPKVARLYPALRIRDNAAGVVFRRLEEHHHEEGEQHEEGEEESGGHDEGEDGRDPHAWLGRQGSKAMAAEIRDALSLLDPSGAAAYARNYEALARDIDAVFAGLAAKLGSLKGRPVFVYHPAFGYFLDEFGIEQVAVETGGKEPTQKGLSALVARAKAEKAAAVFVQAQFPTAAARSLASSIGAAVVPIDDLAPDWLSNLARMGEALLKAARP